MAKIFFLFGLLSLTAGIHCQSTKKQTAIFTEGFDKEKNFSVGWTAREFANPANMAFVTAPGRVGNKALQVSLKKSDPESQYGNKRTELTYNNYSKPEDIDTSLTWWGFSNYFPEAYAADPAEEVIAQWHDKSPTCSASPPLAIQIKDDRFRASIIYSTANYCQDKKSIVQEYFDLGPVQKNSWNKWVIHYMPRTDASGLVEVWINDSLALQYHGPCQYIGSYFPYFKIGLYKWQWMPDWKGEQSTQTERTYFLDDIKIASDGSALRPSATLKN